MLLSEYIQQLRDLLAENGDHPIVTDEDGEVELPEFQPASEVDGYGDAFVVPT